jgi:cell wall-associated NlpC family hydrolase
VTYRALFGRPGERATGGRHRSKARLAAILLITSAAFLASAIPAFADPSSISAKEAEVQSVLNQIDQLDGSLERAIEAYNLANDKLQAIQGELQVNLRELHIARANLKRSQVALSRRLVTLYTTGDQSNSTLGILLGANSIDQMLSQIETANRVSNQDLRINRQIIEFRGAVKKHRIELKNAEAEAEALVQERADQKASIESQLAERKQLVASIRSEIEQMKAEEARRQAELARQARERAAAAAAAPAPIVSNSSSAAPSTTPSPVAAPASGGGNGALVDIAMRYLGIPYVYAGADPSGFDCSGFTMYVYAQIGISLPHNAAMQFGMGTPVSYDQLQPGDLVFFYGLGHVGMYIGDGNFIHSPHTGDVVKISSLAGHYASVFDGARRYT